MKKLMIVALLAVMLSACTETTEFGDCIGINGPEVPELLYAYDAWNIAMGVIFSETLIVPIVVVLDGYKCPIATTAVATPEQPSQPTSFKGDAGLDDDFVVIIVGGLVLSLLSLAFVYWLVVKKFRIGFPRRK